MLILSRKTDEQIVIGDRIVITVVAIRGGTIRLGVDAPDDVPVHRQEVYDALIRQAAKGGGAGGQTSPEDNGGRRNQAPGQLEKGVGQAPESPTKYDQQSPQQPTRPDQPDLYQEFETHIIKGRFDQAHKLLSQDHNLANRLPEQIYMGLTGELARRVRKYRKE